MGAGDPPHQNSTHLEILLGSLSAGPAAEGDEANWRGCLAVLTGHLQERSLVTLAVAAQVRDRQSLAASTQKKY